MGICVNLTAYAAKLCFQAAYNPMIMGPYRSFGTATELMVQDASAFSAEAEELSFWQMQASSCCLLSLLLFSIAQEVVWTVRVCRPVLHKSSTSSTKNVVSMYQQDIVSV